MAAESQTQALADSKQAVAFRPILHDRASAETAARQGEPTVGFEREDGRVTRIKIHCPCGNDIELACDYGQPPTA